MKPTPHLSIDILSSLHDGVLAPSETALARSHLETCDSCREALRELAAVDEALRDEPLEMSESDWDALASRIDDAISRERASGNAARPVSSAPRAGLPEDAARNPVSAPRAASEAGVQREASNRGHEPRVPDAGLWGWLFPRRLALGAAGTLFAVILVVLLRPQASRFTPTSERDGGTFEDPGAATPSSPIDSMAGTGTETKAKLETTSETETGADRLNGAAPEGLTTDQPAPEEVVPPRSDPESKANGAPPSVTSPSGASRAEEAPAEEQFSLPASPSVPRPDALPEVIDMSHKKPGTLSAVALPGSSEATLLLELATLDRQRTPVDLQSKTKTREYHTQPRASDRSLDSGLVAGSEILSKEADTANAGTSPLDREVFLVEALVRLNPEKYCAEVTSRAPRWVADSARVTLSDSAAAIVDILTQDICRSSRR